MLVKISKTMTSDANMNNIMNYIEQLYKHIEQYPQESGPTMADLLKQVNELANNSSQYYNNPYAHMIEGYQVKDMNTIDINTCKKALLLFLDEYMDDIRIEDEYGYNLKGASYEDLYSYIRELYTEVKSLRQELKKTL